MAFGPGSIAFTGYGAASTDALSFVALGDIPAGTVIYFNNGKWDGSKFSTSYAEWSWTATSDVHAGTVVSLDMLNPTAPTSNLGNVSIVGGTRVSIVGGDSIYAYTGAPKAPETFLSAILGLAPQWGGTASLANTGLIQGETALYLGDFGQFGYADIGAYNGPRLGSTDFADYLTQINNPANWSLQAGSGSDLSHDGIGPELPFSQAGFSADPNVQVVSFDANSLTVSRAEGDNGETILTFTVTRTGGTTGTIDFAGTISIAGLTLPGDFGGNVPVSFSGTIEAGQTSGTFTVRVSGDTQFERNENFTLSLQSASNAGGAHAVLGTGTIATGTIVNDDPAPAAIAFVGINTDGGDNLSFVAVSGIAAGTVIYFTDNSWTGSGFTTGESVWSWTAGSNIPAGTIITMDKLNVAGAAASNHGTITFITGSSANLDENNLVEQVYAYLGAPGQPSAFLTAISNGALTLTGTGLTVGVNAIALTPAGADIAYYNGPRTGLTTMEEYLAAINNPANWIKQDTSADNTNDGILPELPFPPHPFSTDPAVQVVQFAAGSLNVAQSEGQNGTETAFTFTIERTNGTNGDVTFSVRVPAGIYATAANGADFVGGALPMITGTIPAGASSTTITILVKGDNLFEVAERFLLVLESASNPDASSVVVGTNSIAAGTINNDDSAPTKILAGETHSAIVNVASQLVIDQGGSLVVPTGNAINWQSANANVVIDNSGLIGGGITSANNNGGSFTLNNNATGVIRGVVDLGSVKAGTAVTLNNAGRIELTTDRMDLRDAKAGPIVVNNLAGGLILQTTVTPDIMRPGAGSVVNNYGTIKHADGLVGGGDGVDLAADAGNVNNYAGGVIDASRHAVTGDGKMRVYNEGTMIGRNGSAVNMDNDGTEAERAIITNRGNMEGRSANLADSDGDAIDIDGLLTLDNYGRVAGMGHNGYHDGEPNVSEGLAVGGGIIRNYEGGEIYGYGRAIQIDNSSNNNALGASTITNEGLIRGDGHGPTGVTPAEAALFAERIRGGEAINIVGSFGDTLTNSGEIIGGVKLGGGNDTLVNSGSMAATGGSAIDMGEGDDTVTLQGASEVLGRILLGEGNDRLTTSAELESDIEVDGGAGDDAITAGAGDDTLSGGDGNDTVDGGIGDDAADGGIGDDVILGGEGDDDIQGGVGNDTIAGGAGDDTIDGGDGIDTADYSDDHAGLVVDFAAGTVAGDEAGSDELVGIEKLVGGFGDDGFIVSTEGDVPVSIDGGAGEDIIRLGGMGAGILGGIANIETVDILSGSWTLTDEDAATTFAFSEGAQTLTLDSGLLSDGSFAGTIAGFEQEDRIHLSGLGGTSATLGEDNLLVVSGGANGPVTIQLDPAADYGDAAFRLVSDGADGAYLSYEIVTNNGDDVMTGGNGNDVLDGGAGNDTLKGGAGNDTLLGGTGVDDIDGGSGLDLIDGGAGNDTIKGGSGEDVIDGRDGDDVIDAGSDADEVLGGAGNDTIKGGSGDDHIVGGAGNDTLSGGSGKDVFVFAAGFGHDAVTDFTLSGASADVISFSTDIFADYAAVEAHAAQDGRDVVITFDADNTLTLHNQQLSALSPDDFRFV